MSSEGYHKLGENNFLRACHVTFGNKLDSISISNLIGDFPPQIIFMLESDNSMVKICPDKIKYFHFTRNILHTSTMANHFSKSGLYKLIYLLYLS